MLTYAAGAQSAEDGAVIALVVSMMRLLVILSKQFGLVGGRVLLSTGATFSEQKTIRKFAVLNCVVLGIVVFGLALWLLPQQFAVILGVMVAVQIVTEPWSGIAFV